MTSVPTRTDTPTKTPTSTPTETPIPNTATPALPGRIEGKIVGSNSQPLKDVKLELKSGTKTIAETTSDSRGRYSFENVIPGTYQIIYTVDVGSGITMHMLNEQFVVESGQTVQQNFVFPY
jgi:protocatechuate 3,4-dioxygenase beta subunit